MEQLDFLLIFTMDVKTYSCAIWYLQFMFEDFKLGKHVGEKGQATSSAQEIFQKWNQKWGAEVLFFPTQSLLLSYCIYLEVEFSV